MRIDMRVRNKTALQTRMGLAPGVDRPLFGVVSRLSDQKGLDLLLEALPGLIAKGGSTRDARLGRPALEAGFTAAAAARPDSVACVLGYDEALAHLIQAGADFIVVPSRFEPCGLTQLCALRYGAPPIVARVGGLADTVIDANEAATAAGVATGVQFYPPVRRSADLCARPRAGDWPRSGDDAAPAGSTACARTCPGAARPSDTPRFIAISPGLPNERSEGRTRRHRLCARRSKRRSFSPTQRAPRSASTTDESRDRSRADDARRRRRPSRPCARLRRRRALRLPRPGPL